MNEKPRTVWILYREETILRWKWVPPEDPRHFSYHLDLYTADCFFSLSNLAESFFGFPERIEKAPREGMDLRHSVIVKWKPGSFTEIPSLGMKEDGMMEDAILKSKNFGYLISRPLTPEERAWVNPQKLAAKTEDKVSVAHSGKQGAHPPGRPFKKTEIDKEEQALLKKQKESGFSRREFAKQEAIARMVIEWHCEKKCAGCHDLIECQRQRKTEQKNIEKLLKRTASRLRERETKRKEKAKLRRKL